MSADLFARAPLPWSRGTTGALDGKGNPYSTEHDVYDGKNIWLGEARTAELAQLFRTAPELLEELDELFRWFDGFGAAGHLVTKDQALRWARTIAITVAKARGGER